MELTSTDVILVLTISTTFLGIILKYAFKSKCDKVSCCFGCLKVHRDVGFETGDIEKQNSGELGTQSIHL
jgi:hypothetical protein